MEKKFGKKNFGKKKFGKKIWKKNLVKKIREKIYEHYNWSKSKKCPEKPILMAIKREK